MSTRTIIAGDRLANLEEAARRRQTKLSDELGDTIAALLGDPDVTEVKLIESGSIWAYYVDGRRINTGYQMSPLEAERLIGTMAALHGEVVHKDNATLAAELPGGERFQGVLPPYTSRPIFNIRKHAARVYTLDDYLAEDRLTAPQGEAIRIAIGNRDNIIVSGSTASGKTTFANAVLHEISRVSPKLCIGILEDIRELKCSSEDRFFLRAQHVWHDKLQRFVSNLDFLIVVSLRLNPDILVVGEVREGNAAMAMLAAWNTGHNGGVCTIHANSAADALDRLEDMLVMSHYVPSPRSIAKAVNLLVHIEQDAHGFRKVTETCRVHGYRPDTGYIFADTKTLNHQEVICA